MNKNMWRFGSRLLLMTLSLGTLFACVEEFQDIGIGIVDNNRFDTERYVSVVEASTVDTQSLKADGLELANQRLNQYLLGVYNSPLFGKLEGNIVSQLSLPSNLSRESNFYGADTIVISTVDTVVLNLPFQYSLDGRYDNGSPRYAIDSIIGNQDEAFDLKIYRLETYLNVFNPSNPAEFNSYYSDRVYDYSDLLNATNDYTFKFSSTDSLSVIKRRSYDTGEVYDIDTLNSETPFPTITIPLNKDYFDQNFVQKFDDVEFDTQNAFADYFRGIFIESSGDDGALLSLPLDAASVNVYYTNTVLVQSSQRVLDTLKKTVNFPLGGIRTNQYLRSNTPSRNSENLYLQGAGGSEVRVSLFGEDTDNSGLPDELEELRTKDWVINEASLSFYIDTDVYDLSQDSIPYRLFIYRDVGEENGVQTLDMMLDGDASIGGRLERDTINDYWRYKLRVTKYITDLMRDDAVFPLNDLRIKIISPTDIPGDTLVRPYNWTGKGVVLHGANSQDLDRKLKLEIFYSKLNALEE